MNKFSGLSMNSNKPYRCIKSFISICALLLLSIGCGGGGGGGNNEERGGEEFKKTFTIGGELVGLSPGQKVELLNNDVDLLELSSNGSFTFDEPIAFNGGYVVTVRTQPQGKTCTIINGNGAGMVASVHSIRVICSTATYKLSGTVEGLAGGQHLTLKNNDADSLSVSSNSTFEFDTPITHGGSYVVTVDEHPTGQTCTVSNGSGAGMVANVSAIQVVCSTHTYTVGGSVSGLAAGQQLTLKNNDADPLIVTRNGTFEFNTPIAYGGSYVITVGTQPTEQTCSVGNGNGAGMVANVNAIQVVCSTNTYSVGGSVTGLAAGQQLTLKNNDADPLIVTSNGTFQFNTSIAYGGSYVVMVGTQPTGQTCSVGNGNGAGMVANVNAIQVVCSTNTYSVGGSVTGLALGQQLTLKNNDDDPLTVKNNGTFEFNTPIAYDGSYVVTVATQPTGQICTVTDGGGVGMIANVNSVKVVCSTKYYTVSAMLSGLASGEQITVKNNDADPVTLQKNMFFTFPTPVAHNGTYAVSVATQLTDEWRGCSVVNASGTATADVINVFVNCYHIEAEVSTWAGSGNPDSIDGAGTNASFNQPMGLLADGNGGLYIADTGNNKIRKIDAEGNVTTWAGSGSSSSADGNGTAATFFRPRGLTKDVNGNLYVTDASSHKIRKIDTARNVTTIAGSGNQGYSDGVGAAASFRSPLGIAIDANGNLYVADQSNHRIRKIEPSGNVTTVAGSGTASFADGNGTAASFSSPAGIAIDSNGNLYVADQNNNRIRKIDSEGNVTTIAGSGAQGFLDGKGITASFSSPLGIALDASGGLYVSEFFGHRIRHIAANGNVSTLAGGVGYSGFADGKGTSARFYAPSGIAVSANGDLHVADYLNHRIRKLVRAKPQW